MDKKDNFEKKHNFENTFDHQDWKQVIVRKNKTKA